MRTCRSLLVLLVLAPLGFPADIHPPKGDPVKGDVVSVSDKEVVFTQGDKKLTKPIKEVLKIDFRDVGKPAAGTTWSSVDLTDGSTLQVSKWLLKKKEMELTLLAGPKVTLPVTMVANVLNEAQNEGYRRDWKSRVLNLKGKEAIVNKRVVEREVAGKKESFEVISSLECTLGEGDETGTSISLAVTLDGETTTAKRKLASLHGIIFKHALDAKATAVCKLLDTLQDVVMVSSVTPRVGGLTVTTPAGAKIDFSFEQIARLDYTKGKLEYLSDLDPAKIVARSNLDDGGDPDQWHVYKDTNLDKKPLVLGGVTYGKGLAMKPYAEVIYDLKGEYREFEAVVGIDDGVSAAGGAILVVEGDGKELATVAILPEEKKRSKSVTLNIKDVQRLRIIVKSDGEFDTARHLDLADAKVRKE